MTVGGMGFIPERLLMMMMMMMNHATVCRLLPGLLPGLMTPGENVVIVLHYCHIHGTTWTREASCR